MHKSIQKLSSHVKYFPILIVMPSWHALGFFVIVFRTLCFSPLATTGIWLFNPSAFLELAATIACSKLSLSKSGLIENSGTHMDWNSTPLVVQKRRRNSSSTVEQQPWFTLCMVQRWKRERAVAKAPRGRCRSIKLLVLLFGCFFCTFSRGQG